MPTRGRTYGRGAFTPRSIGGIDGFVADDLVHVPSGLLRDLSRRNLQQPHFEAAMRQNQLDRLSRSHGIARSGRSPFEQYGTRLARPFRLGAGARQAESVQDDIDPFGGGIHKSMCT